MANYKAGGEIDALCTKCKMTLAHTILAMDGTKPARVQCNTCRGQHNYRGAADAPKPRATSASTGTKKASGESTGRSGRLVVSFDDALNAKKGFAKPYSVKASFALDDVIEHPTFGRGWVSEVRADKIDVTFRTGQRTLIHGKK